MTTDLPKTAGQPLLPFAETELLHVRILPSEFARSLGVNKSTVSRWLKAGTISAGADGRIDPQRATRQLLRNGDPGRFRARIIRQAFGDLAELRGQADRAAGLERELAAAREDAEFHEAAAIEQIGVVDALLRHIRDDWGELHRLPTSAALAAIDAWEAELNAGTLDWQEVSILDLAELLAGEKIAGVVEDEMHVTCGGVASAAFAPSETRGGAGDIAIGGEVARSG
jgi:hypothetical protein